MPATDTYLDEQGNEIRAGGESYLDEKGNDIPAPQIQLPSQKFGDPKELLAVHQENLLNQPQPQSIITNPKTGKSGVEDIPSYMVRRGRREQTELGNEMLKAPIRMAEGIGGLAKNLYEIGNRPSDPESAKRLAKLGYGALEGPIDMGRRALGIYATPKEQAGAIGDIAAGVMLPEIPKAARRATVGTEFAVSPLSSLANRGVSEYMIQGKNQLVTALDASEHTAKALDNTMGDINQYLKGSKRVTKKPADLPTFASVARDTLSEFDRTNLDTINQSLKDVPEFVELGKRRAELNDVLGRLGYYDKNPLMQSFARSSPEVQKVVSEANAVRARWNSIVDEMAPTNVGAANIMRKRADLQQVSDMADIAAKASEHSKRMTTATAPSAAKARLAELVSAATAIGMGQPQIALAVRALKMAMDTKKTPKGLHPDMLVQRAFRNLDKGEGAIAKPIQIKGEPIKLPGAKSANTATPEGQVELPFVPQEVGGIPQKTEGFEGTQGILFPKTHGPSSPTEDLLQNFGGTIRTKPRRRVRFVPVEKPIQAEPIQLPTSQPLSGPERLRSRWTGGSSSRPTIGEAAMTPGATISDAQSLRFHGMNEAADFLENRDATTLKRVKPPGEEE